MAMNANLNAWISCGECGSARGCERSLEVSLLHSVGRRTRSLCAFREQLPQQRGFSRPWQAGDQHRRGGGQRHRKDHWPCCLWTPTSVSAMSMRFERDAHGLWMPVELDHFLPLLLHSAVEPRIAAKLSLNRLTEAMTPSELQKSSRNSKSIRGSRLLHGRALSDDFLALLQ